MESQQNDKTVALNKIERLQRMFGKEDGVKVSICRRKPQPNQTGRALHYMST